MMMIEPVEPMEMEIENGAGRLVVVESEIRMLTGQIAQNMLEIGKRLIEAQELVPRGQWQNWLRESVNYSYRTAARMMQAYRQFGDVAGVRELPAAKVYALLDMPADQAAELVAECDVDGMTVRELQREVKARKVAEEVAEALRGELLEAKLYDELMSKTNKTLAAQLHDYAEETRAARRETVEARAEVERLREQREMERMAAQLAEGAGVEAGELAHDAEVEPEAGGEVEESYEIAEVAAPGEPEWIYLTNDEREVVEWLGDPVYTADHIQAVLNIPGETLQRRHADVLGYYQAVRRLLERGVEV